MKKFSWQPVFCIAFAILNTCAAREKNSRFKALVLFKNGGHHIHYSEAAKTWLDQPAADSNFLMD